MVLACWRPWTYPRSCSSATSDEVSQEGFYICGMTVADPLRNGTATYYHGLPSAESSGTIVTYCLVGPNVRCRQGEITR